MTQLSHLCRKKHFSARWSLWEGVNANPVLTLELDSPKQANNTRTQTQTHNHNLIPLFYHLLPLEDRFG